GCRVHAGAEDDAVAAWAGRREYAARVSAARPRDVSRRCVPHCEGCHCEMPVIVGSSVRKKVRMAATPYLIRGVSSSSQSVSSGFVMAVCAAVEASCTSGEAPGCGSTHSAVELVPGSEAANVMFAPESE